MNNYSKVCEAKTKKEMQRRFNLLLKQTSKKFGGTEESYLKQQLANIGYFAGYYNDEKIRKRVLKWLGAIHPIFGVKY